VSKDSYNFVTKIPFIRLHSNKLKLIFIMVNKLKINY